MELPTTNPMEPLPPLRIESCVEDGAAPWIALKDSALESTSSLPEDAALTVNVTAMLTVVGLA